MTISYDTFTKDFLQKITEYVFLRITEETRQEIIDGYMKHAIQQFSVVNRSVIVDINDEERTIEIVAITSIDADEFVDIITEGMVVQWMKPYMYKQENLENMLSSTDFSSYSPAELLYRIKSAYEMCRLDFTHRVRKYSYDHGDLTDLHL